MKTCIATSQPWIGRTRLLAKGVLPRLSLILALCCQAIPSATARDWTGDGAPIGGVYKLWSDPDNWSPHGVPQNGEALLFHNDSIVSDPPQMFNDLTNLIVTSLEFSSLDAFNSHWELFGNILGISSGVLNDVNYDCQVNIHCGLKLTGNASFVTGQIINLPPAFPGEEMDLHLSGPIDLNGHNLALLADSGDGFFGHLYIEGGITGAGNVVATTRNGLSDFAILEFDGPGNDFSGTLTLNPLPGSTIVFKVPAGNVVNDRLVVTNVGTVRLEYSEQIGDGATVRLSDGATLSLNNHAESIQNLELVTDSNDSRPAILDAGAAGLLGLYGNITTICNNNAQTPAIKGKITLTSGEHDFNVSGSAYAGLDMQAEIQGFGNFTKLGNAALLLTASNSCNSSISVNQGILDVRHNHALGDTAGPTQLFGGTLLLRNVAIADEVLFALGQGIGGEMPGSALTIIGSASWTGGVVLNTNLVVVGGDMTFTGPISGPGGLGCFSGGTMTLSGPLANTFTGTTLVRCPLLQLNKPLGMNAYAGPLVVGGGAGGPYEARWLNFYQNANTPLTLYANGLVNLNNEVDDFGPVTFNGGTIQTGTGFFIANNPVTANPATTTAVMNGNLSLAVTPAYFIVSNGVAEPDLQISAVISGADWRKQGQGTLLFGAANTYSGYSLVEDGILDVENSAALGGLSGNTIVWAGATLRLGGVDGMSEAIQLNGTGFQGTNGAMQVVNGGTVHGGIYLGAPSTISVLQGGGLAIDAVISGTGPLTKIGPGNLYLGGVIGGAGNNTYSGGTIVSSGPLYLSKNQNVIAAPGPLTIGPSTPSVPAVARFVHSGMMSYGSTVTVNLNSLLDLNGNNQTLAQLNLNDGGDAQTGAGILSFTPSAAVNIGTINPPEIGLRASASISGTVELPNLDLMNFNVAPYSDTSIFTTTPELDVPANMFGFGDIHKNGSGRMRLRGNNTFNNSPPTSAGNVQVLEGTLIAASPTALGGTGGTTFVSTSGTLALDGGITMTGEPLSLWSTNSPAFASLTGANTWNGDIQLYRDGVVGVNSGSSLSINGSIFGTGGLTKIYPGTLAFAGAANTYSGDTFVDEGPLVLDKYGTIINYTIAIPHHITMGSAQGVTTASLTENYPTAIAGSVTVNSGSTWLLNTNESFQDFALEGHVPLTLNGNAHVQMGVTGILYLSPGGGIAVNPGSNTTATISGSIGIFADDTGLTVYPTLVNAGSFQSGNPECAISGNISGIFGSIRLRKDGLGALRLTGTNTYTGTNFVNAGTLWVDGIQPQSSVQLNTATRLKGSGTVGDIDLVGSSAVVAPGNSAGMLTCSNFNALASGSGTLEVELNAYTPSGYDQIMARGSVNLTGLSLSPTLNFTSSVGQNFIILSNDASDAVIGNLTGLAQNATLYLGGELFQISYAGGSGNDVVLARLVTPPMPVLTIERVPPASVRLLWPTNGPLFTLQSITNLGATNWSPVTPIPTVNGTNYVVTNATTELLELYRLANP